MSVLFHADLVDREFGSDLFSVAKLTAWAHNKGLEIQTVPPLDGFKFVQVEAFLCAVERAVSETATEEMAAAVVQARPRLAQHRAAEVAPRWLVSADAHTQWRRMLEDAVKRRELTLLDFGSKLPVSPMSTAESVQPVSDLVDPAPEQHQQETGTVKKWTDKFKDEVQAYRSAHGLKKTAEYFKVSQTVISKHIPAGKAKTKKATPFGGLGGK